MSEISLGRPIHGRIADMIRSKWVMFSLLGIISVYYTGYRFAIADNLNILIPVKQSIDPSFLMNDLTFSSSGEIGRLLFTKGVAYLSFIVPLESLFFGLLVISRILLCAGIHKLSYAITKDKGVAFLSIIGIFYLFGKSIPLGDAHVVSSQFYASYLAVAMSFFAIAYFVERKYVLASVILGVGTNIHFLVGTQVFGILLLCGVIDYRRTGWKTILCGFVTYLVISSPELINAFRLPLQNVLERAISTEEYIEIVGFIRTPHHFIPMTWPMERYLRYAVFLVGGFYSYFTARRTFEMSTGIKICLVASGLMLLSLPFIYRSTAIMLYHPFRMSIWPYAIIVICIVDCIVRAFNENSKALRVWAILTMAFLNSPFILLCFLISRFSYDFFQEKKKSGLVFLLMGIGILVGLFLIPLRNGFFGFPSYKFMLDHPVQAMQNYLFLAFIVAGLVKMILREKFTVSRNFNLILIPLAIFLIAVTIIPTGKMKRNSFVKRFQSRFRKPRSEFMDLCSWVKSNTDVGEVIIVPPRMRGFRYFGERAILVNYKFYQLSGEKVKEWYERLDDLSNGELSKNRDKILSRRTYLDEPHVARLISKGYLSLNRDAFLKIGRKYNCSFVVTGRGHLISLERVYQNSKYNVYRL